MSKIIPIQDYFRRDIPPVLNCKDYREEEQLLARVDWILKVSGVERMFVELSLERLGAINPMRARKRKAVRIWKGTSVTATAPFVVRFSRSWLEAGIER